MALFKAVTQKDTVTECREALANRERIRKNLNAEKVHMNQVAEQLAAERRKQTTVGEVTAAGREIYVQLNEQFGSSQRDVFQSEEKLKASDIELNQLQTKLQAERDAAISTLRQQAEREYATAAQALVQVSRRLCALYQRLGLPPVLMLHHLNIPDVSGAQAQNLAHEVSVYEEKLDVVGKDRLAKYLPVFETAQTLEGEIKLICQREAETSKQIRAAENKAKITDPYRDAIRIN